MEREDLLREALTRHFGSDMGAFTALGRTYRGEPGGSPAEGAEIERIIGRTPDAREVMDLDRFYEGRLLGQQFGGLGAFAVPVVSAGYEAWKGAGLPLPNVAGIQRGATTSPASLANVLASIRGARSALADKLGTLFTNADKFGSIDHSVSGF